MRLSISVLSVWLALCWVAPVQAQKKGSSPADLLPASTLGYVEVQKPGQLAKAIQDLFKGSVLENVPDSLAELEAKHPGNPMWSTMSLKMMGLMLSPEVISEVSKGKGAAGAFLGMKLGEKGHPEPEFVFIIQPGTSNAPPLLMRTMMTMAPVKAKETVEGVKIYRPISWSQKAVKVKPGEPQPPPKVETHDSDPSFAMMKDYIFIGSHQAVKDCIMRAKGKMEGDTLGQDKDFQAAQKKVGGEPGLFAFAKMASLMDFMKQMMKGAGPDAAQFMEAYTKLLNPKAMKSTAMSLSLKQGTLHYHDIVLLDPQEKSPLLEAFLPTAAVNTGVLHFAPKDSIVAVAVSNSDGAKRFDKLVKVLDDAIPAQAFGGNKLSDHVKAMEAKLGIQFGADIMGKTTNIGFAIGNPLTAPVKVTKTVGPNFTSTSMGPQIPMVLILETADEKSAQTLTETVVKVSQAAANKEVKPESKTIKGKTVSMININPHYDVCYGLAGNTVVIGPYADGVAQALADGAAKKGLAGDAKAQAQLKEFKEPVGVTVVRPSMLLFGMVGFVAYTGMESKTGATKIKDEPAPKPEPNKPLEQLKPVVQPDKPGQPKDTKTTVTIQKDTPEMAKMKKEMMDILAFEPLMVIGVTRGEDFISREGKSPGWDKFVPKITNYAAEKMMEHGFGGKKATSKEAPPPVDKPSSNPNPKPPEPDGKQLVPDKKPIEPAPLKAPLLEKDKVVLGPADPKPAKLVLNVTGELTKKSPVKDGFYQEVHKVELTGGKKYTINLIADKKKFFDTYLILQDAKGKVLIQNDDGGEGLNSRLVFSPKETATYQIVVTSFKEGETGRYTLTVAE